MEIFLYILLFIFGTMFGSFASVIIYRLRSGEGGMWVGRSHCKTCERNLSPGELIPIFSWLFQGGKCKGCKKRISAIYPLLEISLGILFVATGYFLIDVDILLGGSGLEWFKMIFFLSIMFLSIIYIFYDILYLEIPESVLAGANIITFGSLILTNTGIPIIPAYTMGAQDFLIGHVIIAAIVIGGLYTIMLSGLKEIHDFGVLLSIGIIFFVYAHYIGGANDLGTWGTIYHNPLLSGSLAAFGIFISFFLQIVLSQGKAMGAGDLRIAILMGLLIGVSFAFPAWMITYLIGSFVGIGIIIYSKVKNGMKVGFQHQIPFGPFLACGYFAVLFFHPQISNIIEIYFS